MSPLPPKKRYDGPQPLGRMGLAKLEAEKAAQAAASRELALAPQGTELAPRGQEGALATASSGGSLVPASIKVPVPAIDPKLPHNAKAKVEYDAQGELVLPGATGVKPLPSTPHKWDDGNKHAPGWLNDGLNNVRTCLVCGVTDTTESLIRSDRKGMKHHYKDAYGVSMTSLVELSCPTFLGDVPGAVAEAKQRVRKLDYQMDEVMARVHALEQQNQRLQEQLNAKMEIDVTGFANWLQQVAQMSKEHQLPTAEVAVAGLPYEVPVPIADLVASFGASKVTVDVEFEQDEKELP